MVAYAYGNPIDIYITILMMALVLHQSAPNAIANTSRCNALVVSAQCRNHQATHIVAASSPARLCRRCKQKFTQNHAQACRYHASLYSGGELAKALGFLRENNDPANSLRNVVGTTGLLRCASSTCSTILHTEHRFWDCCGALDEAAPGCCTAPHITYDDAEGDLDFWRRH